MNAINSNNGESWVYTKHIAGGCTAFDNPVNQQIYSEGMEEAFGRPDAVVFSFATNDMFRVATDEISFESAVQSMQTLINQAVVSGATCIVMLEASHRFRTDAPHGSRFEMHMDEWFDHWHRRTGDNEFLGLPYKLLIADISSDIAGDIDAYISDYIHFTPAGSDLAAGAIVEQLNQCPPGRWIFGENKLKPEAEFPPNPHLQ